MSAGAFHGVPDETVAAIGRVVIAAGIVEGVARDILLDLGEPAGKKQAANVLDAIRSNMKSGLPALVQAHARTGVEELREWCAQASRLLDDRNRLVHSVPVQMRRENAMVLLSQHIRSGEFSPSDRERVLRLSQEVDRCIEVGRRLHTELLRSPREGVYLRNVVPPGGGWVLVWHGSDAEFPRPSQEELDTWWRDLGPWWVIEGSG